MVPFSCKLPHQINVCLHVKKKLYINVTLSCFMHYSTNIFLYNVVLFYSINAWLGREEAIMLRIPKYIPI